MPIERVIREAVRERERIKRMLDVTGHAELNARMIQRIHDAFVQHLKEPATREFAMEVGHAFLREHVVAHLFSQVDLDMTPQEKKWIRAILGTRHEPDMEENRRKAKAAENLLKLGKRGDDLFQAASDACIQVNQEAKKVDYGPEDFRPGDPAAKPHYGGMFKNPSLTLPQTGDLATFHLFHQD